MSNKPELSNKKFKNLKILLFPLICVLLILLWNIIGAVQCVSRNGEVKIKNFGISCHIDYSQH